MNYVYGLYENEEPDVCYYVGATAHPKHRLSQHRKGRSLTTREWVNKADQPVMKILGRRTGRKAALKLEHFWIHALNPILNVYRNGIGESHLYVSIRESLHKEFVEIKKCSVVKMTIPALVSYAIRNGIDATRKFFQPTVNTKSNKKKGQ